MISESANDPRQACIQQLESDLFLGAKALPLDRAKVPSFSASLGPDNESAIPPSTMTAQEKRQALDALEEEVKACQKCPLWRTRTNTVFSRGNPASELVFVGEAPGYYEDQQGLPFVGRAGKLLDDIITKGMGLSRDDIEFDFSFDPNLHDRWIETDTGWRIMLGRGLDIFQKPDDKFTLGFMDQTKRKCKATSVVFTKPKE